MMASGLVPDAILDDRLQDGITLAIGVLVESFPFVVFGVLLSIVVQVWIPETWLLKIMPRTPWLRRLVTSLLGFLMPVCECGNVPVARGFMIRGLGVPEAMTFLIAAPILNPVTVLTTAQAFGWSSMILFCRVGGALVIANLLGWIYSRHPNPMELLTPGFRATCTPSLAAVQPGRWRRSLTQMRHEFAAMLPALVIGSALAGAIQILVSRETLLALGSDPVWSVLAMMALAFVVAICSNVDAFFILGFSNTFLPGGIVAFLTFGAMIDIKMLALLRTTLNSMALAQLAALIALLCLMLGLVVNLVI